MLLAYALRRCADRADAHDVVAETFLVLWRRLDDAPSDEETVLWLYGIARRILANRQRAQLRRQRLAARLTTLFTEKAPDVEEIVSLRLDVRAVIDAALSLHERDREILLLAAWERLSTAEIASVLGCSENAAALRLHRARRRLVELHRKETGRSDHKNREWPQLRRQDESGQG